MASKDPTAPTGAPSRQPTAQEERARRLFETAAVIELAVKAVDVFDGDEEGVDIVNALAIPVDALQCAHRALIDIASELSSESAAPHVTLIAFPSDRKTQIIEAICGATGLSAAEAKERAEDLSATVRALVSDSALAEELEGLGATVQVRS